MTTPGTLTPTSFQDNFFVVLVEPEESLNVGSVARAMGNLGYKNLRLVAPKKWSRRRAGVTACWGEGVLDTLQIFDSYADALSDMEDVAGFSVREGKNRNTHYVIDEWLLKELPVPLRKTALVFGPEDNGLRLEHLELCRTLIRIPSVDGCRAYNLAQSVLIALYELSKKVWGESVERINKPQPQWNDLYQLDKMVEQVLYRSGYYHPGTPDPIPSLVKMMFRRMEPDDREARVLLGIFSRIDKALKGEVPLSSVPEEIEKKQRDV